MQDSLGGNAKTLMFVNISPSNFNLDETLMSLTYATRVKQVTNGATRNAESKEVARLKNVRIFPILSLIPSIPHCFREMEYIDD
jgi:kinesin family protein C2/C3